jgi:predicted PurR-regulated permease PerM
LTIESGEVVIGGSPPGKPPPPIDRSVLVTVFFFSVLFFLLYELYEVFSPFLSAIAWGAILVIIFYPVHQWIMRRMTGKVTLASAFSTFLVISIVILPGILFVETLASQVVEVYRSMSISSGEGGLDSLATKFEQTPVGTIWYRLKQTAALYEIDIESILQGTAKTVSVFLADQLKSALVNIFASVMSLIMIAISLFFFFRDGEGLYRVLRSLIPMDEGHKDVVFSKLYETISAVVRGLIVTAAFQGVLGGLAYWVLNVPYPTLLGFLTALFALIPVPGSAAVWLPASGYLFYRGFALKGIILIVWGVLVVSGIDNVLKPLLIGSRTNLPTLFLFFSILGGVQVYGFLGLVLGPVLLAILIAFLDIYRDVYHQPTEVV